MSFVLNALTARATGMRKSTPTKKSNPAAEPGDLAALSRASHLYEQALDLMGRAWQGIEASSVCSKESSEEAIGHRFREYNNPVRDLTLDLLSKIKHYPERQLPDDILELFHLEEVETLSEDKIQRLQKFIQARDTLVVWERLAEQCGIDLDHSEAFVSADAAITKAEEFSAWMGKNSESLSFTDLNLNGMQLTSIPSEIGQLEKLQRLQLAYNQLTSIPHEIWQLTRLEVLFLHHNQLTSIPSEIGQLGSLQILVLEENQLTSLPPEIGQLGSLQELDLAGNPLRSIPPEMRIVVRS